MKVLPTQTADAVATRSPTLAPTPRTRRAFKAVLAQAATDTSHAGPTSPHDDPARRASSCARARRWSTVEGHAYAEITAGSRDGMFINTSGNVRNGADVRAGAQERQGVPHLRHRQGPSRGRLPHAVEQARRRHRQHRRSLPTSRSRTSSDIKLRKGEKIEPVEGHAYAEITSGPRSGMYINTSGNTRHGEAFVLVEQGRRRVPHLRQRRRPRGRFARSQARRRRQVVRHGAPKRAAASSGGISGASEHRLRHQLRRPRPERDAPRRRGR